MEEYRAIRVRKTMLELIDSPELAAEITLQPLKHFDLDAAILFADILPPLRGMGLELAYAEGDGPVFPIRCARHTISTCWRHLRRRNRWPARSRQFASWRPSWRHAASPARLRRRAVYACLLRHRGWRLQEFRQDQVDDASRAGRLEAADDQVGHSASGLSARTDSRLRRGVQIFDSWAGQAVGVQDYVEYVQPFNRTLIESVAKLHVPIINFSTGTAGYLEEVAACGGDVISVDWRIPLDRAGSASVFRSRSRATSTPLPCSPHGRN